MSTEAEEDDPEENRRVAAGLVSVLQETIARLLTLGIDLAKWLITTLLALNGAAILAVWQANISTSGKLIACGIFLAGIFFSLLSGLFAVKFLAKVGKSLGEMTGYWISVQADGARAEELEDFDKLERFEKHGRPSSVFGWLAAICFFAGAITAALSASANQIPQQHRPAPDAASNVDPKRHPER